MTALPRPDLPPAHPQNIPLREWSDGWLKLSCSDVDPNYVILHDHEKLEKGYPVTRDEMIEYLVSIDQIPAAGIAR